MSEPIGWRNRLVYITGGAGMIGSHLVDVLLAQGADVYVVDDLSRGRRENLSDLPDSHFIQYDLTQPETRPDFAPQAIWFHLAAKVASIEYNRKRHLDMMQHNLAINWHYTELMRHPQIRPRLVTFVSTACIYSHDAPVPTPEAAGVVGNPEPTNWGYGVAKWVGEQQARFLYEEARIPAIVVRFYNALGPRDYYDEKTSHVAPALIQRTLDGQDPLVVWGTGAQTRAFVDARDIARALALLAETPAAHDARPINIGHEREVTIADLAHTIMKLAGRRPNITFDRTRPDGYARRAADSGRLRGLIGWAPDTPLETSLTDMIADYRARYRGGYDR